METLPLTPLEAEVMGWLLNGEMDVLVALRQQLALAQGISRHPTGQGYYLHFQLPDTIERLQDRLPVRPNFCFGDVEAAIEPLEGGAGFLLWVSNGVLNFLEVYTYGESWPAQVQTFELCYFGDARDETALRKQWSIP